MPLSQAEVIRTPFLIQILLGENSLLSSNFIDREKCLGLVVTSIRRDSWEGANFGQGHVASNPALPW